MASKRKKIITGIILGLLLAAGVALTVIFYEPIKKLALEPEVFRGWVDAHPFVAELAYVGLVIAQIVIAFLPGEPFELFAGYAFGALKGTLLCVFASTVGSMAVFFLVRIFGKKIVNIFFSEEKIEKIKFLKTTPGRDLLYFIIFLIPGTPKDILCYFAGMTDMKWYVWLLICSVGKVPSIITSTLGGSAFGDKNYLVGGIILGATLLISIVGFIVYRAIIKKKNADGQQEEKALSDENNDREKTDQEDFQS